MIDSLSISFSTQVALALAMVTLVQGNTVADDSETEAREYALFSDIRELPVAARRGARDPDLAVTREGQPFLSWQEPDDNGNLALRVSTLTDGGWSAANTVATGDDWFVSWGDSPSLAAFGNDGLAATWLVKNGPDEFAYDLNVSLSDDAGATWGEPIVPHQDGTPTQHGLASMLPWPDGRLFITWLDGRVNAQKSRTSATGDGKQSESPFLDSAQSLPTDDMTLRSALIDVDGEVSASTLLDDRVCTCCATAVVMTEQGALVGYRDRSDDEVRDIAVKSLRDGQWSKTRALHNDGWKIAGCPVNGQALSASGQRVAASWFTAADDQPRLLIAFSDDAGEHFGQPFRVDDGRPLGRTDVVLLDDGSALVSWLEVSSLGEELRVRHILPDGQRGAVRALVSSNQGRTIGFPRMVRRDNDILFAWTQPGESPSVRTAILKLPDQ